MPVRPRVADLHSDLLLDVEHRRLRGERDVMRRRHLPWLRGAGFDVVVLAVWVPTAAVPDGALRHALRLVETAHREAEESDGAFRIVTSAADLDAAARDGALAGVLSLEGAEPLGREPQLVGAFARLGVRLVGPAWNRANAFSDGAAEPGGGLTALGVRLLGELADRDLALDLSHLPDTTALAAVERFEGPVLASHSNAAAVYGSSRNAPDELIAAVGARGGVVGLNLQRAFLGPGDPADRLAAHETHVRAVAGADVPALGPDLTAYLPAGPAEPVGLGYPPDADRRLVELPEIDRREAPAAIADALARRGRTAAEVEAVLHGNALRFLRGLLG